MNTLITALWQRHRVVAVFTQPPPATARSQSREYRAQAAECQQVANRWPDDLVKEQYEELARQWRALAEHAEGQ
jgi:methionyl-tRNA formyltransferase